MKRILCLSTAVLAGFLAGCGGGGNNIVPPPPAGGFTNANLKGQYAFSMVGISGNCSVIGGSCGAYIARVGSFIADGNGNVTSGLEDVLDLGTGLPAAEVSFTSGSYEIQANGRGSITLVSASGGLMLSLSMIASSKGYLIQTDLKDTGSGGFNLQTPSEFATSSLHGNYVFDFSGVSFSGVNAAPISTIGQIATDGNGNITGGTLDDNDGNVAKPSGALNIAPGTYTLDPSANGSTFGRATMSFFGRNYVYYIVDATHIKVLEEDGFGGTSGDAVLQSGSIPAQNTDFKGSFAYLVGGASVLGSQGPIAREARFTTDGNGGIGAISYDENNSGNYFHISQGSNISNATYTIDTAHAGSGRGTFTFTDSKLGTYTYVFYLSSSSQAALQDTSPGVIGDGPMLAQAAGPLTVAGAAGNYAFSWSGVQLGSSTAVPFEEDFAGQYALTSASKDNITGVVDYVELGLSTNSNPFLNVGISGTFTVKGDGTNNNPYSITLGGSPSSTVNFQAYFVDVNTVLLVCSDSNRTTAGIATRQSQ